MYDGISTVLIDELTAQQCASLSTTHPDYGILASRILISNCHKNTKPSLLEISRELYNFKDNHNKQHPIISKKQMNIIEQHHEVLEQMIDYERDYLIDYFGYKTLERAYLLRINKVIVERPQHMWIRVAICIHKDNWKSKKLTILGQNILHTQRLLYLMPGP